MKGNTILYRDNNGNVLKARILDTILDFEQFSDQSEPIAITKYLTIGSEHGEIRSVKPNQINTIL